MKSAMTMSPIANCGSSPSATPEKTTVRQPNRSASSVVTNAALTLPIPEPDIRADAVRRGTDALTDANRREVRVLDLPPPQTFTQSLLLNIPCRITPATQSDDHAAC
jgi:hypothetical protein